MTPAEQLKRLKVAIEAGQPVPGDVGAWLLDGIEDFEMQENDEKITPLCKKLGLRPAGRRSIPYRRRLAERDQALCDALARIPVDGLTDRQRCAQLLQSIRRFETTTWLRIRTRPMASLSDPLKDDLRRAFNAGTVPRSIEGLANATSK